MEANYRTFSKSLYIFTLWVFIPPPGARNPDPGLLINLSRGLYENCYYAISFSQISMDVKKILYNLNQLADFHISPALRLEALSRGL